jgi:hypothetical protein
LEEGSILVRVTDEDPAQRPATQLVCPCGAPVPAGLPGPGERPVHCPRCATPLVAPGRVSGTAFEMGLAAAVVVAVLFAAAWAALCYVTGSGAPWLFVAGGLAVGIAARMAARARGGRVQLAAGIALFVFLALGEFLIYRHALLPRLEAMYVEEGAPDADVLAREELQHIQDDPERYASLEATRDLFLAMAAGIAAALWVTRARPAVAAFSAPSSSRPSSSASHPSQEPPASQPSSGPASPGSAPPSSPPPDPT